MSLLNILVMTCQWTLHSKLLQTMDNKPVRVTRILSFTGRYLLPTDHVSGSVLGPRGRSPKAGDKPSSSGPACGQTTVSDAGGQVCGTLKAAHPHRKQDKRTEVPICQLCLGKHHSWTLQAKEEGIRPGVSSGGQQWGEVIRGVCAASLTLPGLSGEGGDSGEEKESQMTGPVQISFL